MLRDLLFVPGSSLMIYKLITSVPKQRTKKQPQVVALKIMSSSKPATFFALTLLIVTSSAFPVKHEVKRQVQTGLNDTQLNKTRMLVAGLDNFKDLTVSVFILFKKLINMTCTVLWQFSGERELVEGDNVTRDICRQEFLIDRVRVE